MERSIESMKMKCFLFGMNIFKLTLPDNKLHKINWICEERRKIFGVVSRSDFEQNEIYIFLLISNLIPNNLEGPNIRVLQKSRVPMKSVEIAKASGLDKKEVDNG